MIDNESISKRKAILRNSADAYFKALLNADFSLIPFHREIILRAPIVPGGSEKPLNGIGEVKNVWWDPLLPALKDIKISKPEYFYNDSLTGIVAEAEIVLAGPGITLRVADRFYIDDEGRIIEQENHFDASPLKNGNN